MKFRNDINGLRAVSVLAVVLYHFDVRGFSGGFVGVDVFFVISGYLMTGIITSGLQEGRFSLSRFYLSRARRIIPALFVLSATLLTLAWFYLLPKDYQAVAKGALASITFVSNFAYWRQSGYFDVAAQSNWFLHTWSLSVEWQFYMLFPIFMMACCRLSSRPLPFRYPLIALCAASLLASVAGDHWPIASFYLLPTRAWELTAGGVLYVENFQLPNSKVWGAATESVGLGLLAGAVLLFHPAMMWPGYAALVPVAGCALVIVANQQASIWSTNRVSRWLGLRSYSIYLWHWPLIAAFGYFSVDQNRNVVALAFLVSLTLGAASYSLIEQPIGHLFPESPLYRRALLIAAMVGTATLASGIVLLLDGFPSRVPPEVLRLAADTAYVKLECAVYKYPITNVSGCHIGRATQPETVILIGDSHALSLLSAVDEALKRKALGGRIFSAISCPPILGLTFPVTRESDCIGFYSVVRSKMAAWPQSTKVILAGRWSSYLYGHNEDTLRSALGFEGVDNFESMPMDGKERIFAERIVSGICQFSGKGKVYVVSSIPEMKYNIPMRAARDAMFGLFSGEQYVLSRAEYALRNQLVNGALAAAAEQCGAGILDPTKSLCDADQCYGMRNGRPIYIDSNHLNTTGDSLLIPMFEGLFR